MLLYINTIHDTVKFTLEFNTHQQRFLDVMVTLNNGSISTSLYRKETDCNTALLRTSYHPPNVFKGVLSGHLTRLHRITSDHTELQQKTTEISTEYQERGYTSDEILDCLKKVKQGPEPSQPAIKDRPNFPILLCQYGPHIPLLRRVIKNHWATITSDPNLRKIFPEPPRLVFRKARAISNWVTRSDIKNKEKPRKLFLTKKGTYPCMNCCHCSAVIKGDVLYHPTQGYKIPIKGSFTCQSKNVIYVIKCPCGLPYVGQTSRSIKTRISEHKSTIRAFYKDPNKFEDKKETTLARHFHQYNHNVSDLKWQVIDQINTNNPNDDTKRLLLRQEVFWIHTLNSLQPTGLNEDCNYNSAWKRS